MLHDSDRSWYWCRSVQPRQSSDTSFAAKCLDESFALQCVNLFPQGWASSMVYWTLQWAYHTSHRAPLHTRDHAAMFMRSTPGYGTLAGPSLEWVAFRSPSLRPNGFAESPGLKRPGALGRPEMPGSSQLKRKSPAEDHDVPLLIPKWSTNSIVIWTAKSIFFSCSIHFPPF